MLSKRYWDEDPRNYTGTCTLNKYLIKINNSDGELLDL